MCFESETSHPEKKSRLSEGGSESEKGVDKTFEPVEKGGISEVLADYYLKLHPPPPNPDPSQPERKYVGSLDGSGVTFNSFWYPPRWLLNEQLEQQQPITKAIMYKGTFVAPTDEILDKFLATLEDHNQDRLRPYFKTIQKSMGFKVPVDLPLNSNLPFTIIRPFHQYSDPKFRVPIEKLSPRIEKCAHLALSLIDDITGGKHTFVQDVNCANVQGVESANVYRCWCELFFLTFILMNEATSSVRLSKPR
ncbi:hypothetical protein Tsubulata_004816 [Turnera subulata]|uniref:Uncharacterized protein n=1 Tax=Turnera subulata TaxID=218843 RepID=A0A9Q0FBZ9_9ROSI|nr:hypothetical protein Tsubulata_004816 [Turnera subulata]